MKHTATRQLFSYWNGLRGERAAPERSEIDPTAIRDILADTFMLDVDLAGRFPFRLAGTRVNGLLGAEQKGVPFLDLWRREERRNLSAILLTVADGSCPIVVGGVASAEGVGECATELLLLPLRHHGKTHARILGLIKTVTAPTWLGLLPIGLISLRSLRILDASDCETEGSLERIAVGQSTGPVTLAEHQAPVSGARAGKPKLRVIQGGL